MGKKQTKRNNIIRELRRNRYKFREIGQRFNLTKQRIEQICLGVKFKNITQRDIEKELSYFIKECKEQIIIKDNGCHEWNGIINYNGYGRIYYRQKMYMAHRFIYEHTEKSIPKNKILHHVCQNRACVNPKHLELTDLSSHCAGHHKKLEKCFRGHKFTEENTYPWIDIKGRQRRHCRKCIKIRDQNRKKKDF